MCFVNNTVWEKCGHYCIRHEMCHDARARSPPRYCASVHEPIATVVGKDEGVCPDESKHSQVVTNGHLLGSSTDLRITTTKEESNAA